MKPDSILLYLIIIIFAVIITRYYSSLQSLLGLRYNDNPDFEVIERKDVPQYIEIIYAQIEKELAELEYNFIFAYVLKNKLLGISQNDYYYIFYNEKDLSYAEIVLSVFTDVHKPVEIVFTTILNNGKRISTYNCYKDMFLNEPASLENEDSMEDSIEGHYKFHIHRIEKYSREDILKYDGNNEKLLKETKSIYLDSIDISKSSRQLKPSKYGGLEFSFKSAFVLIGKMVKANKKRILLLNNYIKKGKKYILPNEFFVEKYFTEKEYRVLIDKKLSSKMILFFFSIVAFLIVSMLLFKPIYGVIITAIILLHEMGHFLAMKAFGYKDLKMVFIPLFGGMVSGNKKNVKPHHEIISLFAGPLPGIILGFALIFPSIFIFREQRWIFEAVIMVLVVNYLNLLPIMPLDGGQIMNNALFSKNKIVGYLFYILSIIGLIALSIFLKSSVALFVAPIIIIGLFSRIKNDKILSKVERKIGIATLDERVLIKTVFEVLEEKEVQQNVYQKYITAKNIETEYLNKKLSTKASIVTIVLYISIFLLPIVGVLGITGDKTFNVFNRAANTIKLKNNMKRTFNENLKKAQNGDKNLYTVVGLAYQYGQGTEKNIEESKKWYTKAMDEKMGEGFYYMGYFSESEKGQNKNIKMAIKYYEKAYENNYEWVAYSLGNIYKNYPEVADEEKSLYWFEKAALQGQVDTQLMVAEIYFNRIKKEKDEASLKSNKEKAYIWYYICEKYKYKEPESIKPIKDKFDEVGKILSDEEKEKALITIKKYQAIIDANREKFGDEYYGD